MYGWGSFYGVLASRSIVATFTRSGTRVDRTGPDALPIDALRDLAVIPPRHEVVIWTVQKDLAYRARADKYTLAREVRSR
jgi:hypothetical protein